MKTKQASDLQVDEIILQSEQAGQDKKNRLSEQANINDYIKSAGDKISLILVLALLLVSIVQGVELFNLRNQILKGKFSAVEETGPASGGSQALPSQQGGC